MPHLQKMPSDARYYGVTFDCDDDPGAEAVAKGAPAELMISIRLCWSSRGCLVGTKEELRP